MAERHERQAVSNEPFHTPAPGRLIEWGWGSGARSRTFVLGDATRTGRRVTSAIHEVDPGHEEPLHAHTLEDEGIYVLEGEITVAMPDDGIELTVTAGEFVWMPLRRVHGWTAGSAQVRLLQFLLPGTDLVPHWLESRDSREPGEDEEAGPDTMRALIETARRRFGLEIVGPDGPGEPLRPHSDRGPLTPDARVLHPEEMNGVANRPFKSDPSRVFTIPQARMAGRARDRDIIFHAFGHQTGNVFGLLELIWHEPAVVPPHVHTLEDEYFFVLEGEFALELATEDGLVRIVGKPGDWLWGPRDIPHCYIISTHARVLSGEIPGGTMVDFFLSSAAGHGRELMDQQKWEEFTQYAIEMTGMHFLTREEWPGEWPEVPTPEAP